MLSTQISDFQDILNDDLRQRGDWIVAYIDPAMGWPTSVQSVLYLDQEYFIIPITNDACPAVAVRANADEKDLIRERILRFLSVLCWVESSGITLVGFGGGSFPFALKRTSNTGLVIRDRFDFSYLPEVTSSASQLALALMREARGLTHIAYSFLSFYRVLEVSIGKGKVRDWINSQLQDISDREARKVLSHLHDEGIHDIARHIYISGRCAIAHASGDPIIDPDNPTDVERLSRERPLVEALAELAVEKRLGVKTLGTVYDEHLYELSGFKAILGSSLVFSLTTSPFASPPSHIPVPTIDIGLVGEPPFPTLQNCIPYGFSIRDQALELFYSSSDGYLHFTFRLDFKKERLNFDIYNDLKTMPDDGSREFAACKAGIEAFSKLYFMNGKLSIRDSDSGELISRKDAFIPCNVIVKPDEFDKNIEFWNMIAESRINLHSA